MKKYILLLLMFVSAFSSEVCGQSKVIKSYQHTVQPFCPRWFSTLTPVLPRRDTVILLGDEIEVGGYLCEVETKDFEIIGYAKAQKSDYKKVTKKGSYNKYSIKLKPQQSTTYEFRWIRFDGEEGWAGRKVYVAKTEEGRKRMQKQLNKILGRQSTTYQYVNPDYNVKIGASSNK